MVSPFFRVDIRSLKPRGYTRGAFTILQQAKKIPAAARGVGEADMKDYPKFMLPQNGASGKAGGAVSFRGISNRPNL